MVASYTAFGDKWNDPAKCITFGGGDPLASDAVYGCLKIMEEESVAIPWEKGDVLLIDNLAVLHSRKLFTPPRRIFLPNSMRLMGKGSASRILILEQFQTQIRRGISVI
ncbi:Clavaminate synthase-like protein At3g21360 [Linum perenne]